MDSNKALSLLGVDPNNLVWTDLSLCSGLETNLFYDAYESSSEVATVVDDLCLSCQVMTQCLLYGVENGEWGTWGGVYLTSGKPDKNKNSHKTDDIWEDLRRRIGEQSIF